MTPHSAPAHHDATKAGTNPLSVSRTTTAIPRPGPKVRHTFVAPMLPLPTVRMSTPRNQRTSQYPNGSEPER